MFDKMNSVQQWLIYKHPEMHGCILSSVATDALVLERQSISIHSPD